MERKYPIPDVARMGQGGGFGGLNKLVEQPLDHFLPTAGHHRFSMAEGVFLEIRESGFSCFHIAAYAAVPRFVTFRNELFDAAIRTNRRSGF